MNGFAVERILARPTHGLNAVQQQILRRMADFLDRNSLRIVWDNAGSGSALEIQVSNDAERFALTMDELAELWVGMRHGRSVEWSRLRRVER